MADASSVRQRKPAPADNSTSTVTKTQRKAKDEDEPSILIDALRVLTFLLLASCGLSYLISGGDNPLELTLEQLAAFDGTDESRPIYLAINGTIYDVTVGRRIYGPGGSYHWFAGCDASRGYVTGCFADDRTADMRGAEEMFLPIEDPEINALYTREELRDLAARSSRRPGPRSTTPSSTGSTSSPRATSTPRRHRQARKGWLKNEPRRQLCEAAQQGRVKRKAPERGGEDGKAQ
ncbi:unnamed protein product [Parascedosporium putredinis]|uniref:Cytochrome b5 heme-binding domain-containing protein n=1 Tax=Parascedosporium putredinis TaxID=1442378 RepID=A0A9P1MBU3_9PEZI|nr:unnamed protein product [Parascedosporium putredinis]CAI7999379.1 unnamed protein product [Parascedosporium putredinis]